MKPDADDPTDHMKCFLFKTCDYLDPCDECISGKYYIGSVALLSHNTLKWSAIVGLSFVCAAGGLGNPCYGVQARLVNFALHFQKC